jgi:hypothetical protein
MKINEVIKPRISLPVSRAAGTFYRKHQADDIDSHDNLEKKLKKYGWRYLSSGALSNVFGNSKKSYVLKINKQPDPAFQSFVNLIKKYPNKHFPKISDMKEYKVGKKKYYVYMIEKLYKVRDEFIKDLIYSYANGNPIDVMRTNADYLEYLNKHPSLKQALDILIKNEKRHRIDLHSDNFMKRKDGTIVLTDPYAPRN